MKVAYVQFAPALGDVDLTMQRISGLASRFASAELAVLPELCNSGYGFGSVAVARAAAETVDDSPFLRFLESLCRAHGQHIVTGFNERAGDRLYNSAVLVGPRGPVGIYRKLHLFLDEKDYFAPGNRGLPVFAVGEARLGLLVCFDWIFPEVWRILALRGADLVCHPSNLVLPGRCQQAVPVHALVNRLYVVTANRIGREGPLTFTGGSLIADPKGEVLARAPDDAVDVAVVEIDLAAARDKQITARNHLLGDRRPGEYGALCDPANG